MTALVLGISDQLLTKPPTQFDLFPAALSDVPLNTPPIASASALQSSLCITAKRPQTYPLRRWKRLLAQLG